MIGATINGKELETLARVVDASLRAGDISKLAILAAQYMPAMIDELRRVRAMPNTKQGAAE